MKYIITFLVGAGLMYWLVTYGIHYAATWYVLAFIGGIVFAFVVIGNMSMTVMR